jgi:hypothetical protein
MSQIDAMVLARFAAGPGAAELIEALADIPEGPLRDSIIHMAITIRDTYRDTTSHVAIAQAQVQALPPPEEAQAVLTKDPKVRAVELLLQGKDPGDIAKQLSLMKTDVMNAKREARRSGLRFPRANAKVAKKAEGAVFVMAMSQVTKANIMRLESAAKTRGISMVSYLGRRAQAIEMAMQGRHIFAIVQAVGESEMTLRSWFNQARGAGMKVPFMASGGAELPSAEIVSLHG